MKINIACALVNGAVVGWDLYTPILKPELVVWNLLFVFTFSFLVGAEFAKRRLSK